MPAAMGCVEALSGLFPCEGTVWGDGVLGWDIHASSGGGTTQKDMPPLCPQDAILSPQLVKTHDLSPSHNYIIGSHPHGILCVGAFCNFITGSTGFGEMFPGIRPFLTTLAGNFRLPVFREYLMSGGECLWAVGWATACHPALMGSPAGMASCGGMG